MSPGLPSLTALLSLLAVGGWQNRNELAELLGDEQSTSIGGDADTKEHTDELHDELGGLLDSLNRGSAGGLGGLLGGASVGSALNGALSSLMEHFGQNGFGTAAKSWIGKGANEPIEEAQLERALGNEMIGELTQRTGLSRQELLARLSRELPKAVDELTPEGTLLDQGQHEPQERTDH